MAVHTVPKGITLMEVLIAIGILAVGLTSVVSLVPAGQSQAARAVILDRAAATVANGLQDAATYGLLREDSVAFEPVAGGPVYVFDPVVLSYRYPDDHKWFPGTFGMRSSEPIKEPGYPYLNSVNAWIKPSGVYSQATSPDYYADGNFFTVNKAPWTSTWYGVRKPLMGPYAQSRDDVVFRPSGPSNPDDPPTNFYDANNVRMFNGRMTCIYSIALADNRNTALPKAGDVAKLTVVAFHNRNLTDPAAGWIPASYDGVRLTISPADIPSGRTLKDVIRPGVVIYDPNKTLAVNQYLRWSQVLMASVDSTDGSVYVTFASPPPTATPTATLPLRILLDSVGMAEQMVVLEGSGAYSK
jgi:type II secretory pathway pseudopilin PulG